MVLRPVKLHFRQQRVFMPLRKQHELLKRHKRSRYGYFTAPVISGS